MTLSLKSFAKNTSGAVAVWAALTTPVLVGGAALSVDASRLYNMDSDLQAASDALARAGAAELDQRPDSLQRSAKAMQRLLTLDQKFAKRGQAQVEIESIRFLKSLPATDYAEIPSSLVTYQPSEAKFVEVKVKPETVSTIFPASFVSRVTDVTMSSKSVAGLDQTVCGVAPVFICNPYEGTNVSIYDAMETSSFKRRQIAFKTPHNSCEPYTAGNFGWLDPFGGNSGASKLADAVAIDIPPVCMSKSSGVVLRSGNISSMRHAVNTRFDVYGGPFKKKRTDPRYAPAANVVKGYAQGRRVCSERPNWHAMGLPRDTSFNRNRIGNGNWDFLNYMRVNHNEMSRITIENVTYKLDYRRGRVTPSTPPSRYAMYRWEIDNDCVPGAETYGNNASTPEEGLPQCHASGASTTVEDRRIIHAAVLNCGAIEAESKNGMWRRKDALPVETFVKVFLTEPMGKGQQNMILGEIVGPVVEGDDTEARDQVALAQ
ncbi:TadE/TadG family type IV pilus assembly protein [Litorimonas sp. RW-G-Af-16]|uniref:TadE/TadG family type IV pilus assembly protein n=1 Tax=Litorimonas sp. RW-G-Af-16 TaxID=3241168 RepID=UPI003AAC5E55